MGKRGPAPKIERNARIAELAGRGRSLTAIARRFGISHQRVDQILRPKRLEARMALARAVQEGKVERADACESCGGSDDIEAHHPDYEKSLEVRWLCRSCHRDEHRGAYRRPRIRRRIEVRCPQCGKSVRRRPSDTRWHCSRQCADKASSKPKISNAELLTELRRLARRYGGRTPTSREVIDHGRYSHTRYYERFGSFRAACAAAGLEVHGTGGAGHRSRGAA